MEPDLSSTITLHPHPFPYPGPSDTSHRHSHADEANATSTGVEPVTDDSEHPVARLAPAMAPTDVESQSMRHLSKNDPYNLASAFKTEDELRDIKANTSRRRDVRTSSSAVDLARSVQDGRAPRRSPWQARKVKTFYRSQNETIQRLLKPVEEHRTEAAQQEGVDQLRYRIAVYGSFVANVLLAVLQIYGAVGSRSLSLFTTMADSIFDPLSNLTLILTHRAVKRVDPNRFPSGKARLETSGNIVFCFVMMTVSAILVAFSSLELVRGKESATNDFHLPAVIAVCVAFATKFVLFLYCWGIKDKFSQVDIVWQDHRNDLLINGFGVLTSVGGSKLMWWIDPMGAIILSFIVSAIWLRTALKEFLLLVGVVASVEMQQLITYVCVTHSPAIREIDTVRVYHSGPRLIAEVDVVMDPEASLQDTHDVAEHLQYKLEDLPDVERAYVHVDWESSHKPEHALKKDL